MKVSSARSVFFRGPKELIVGMYPEGISIRTFYYRYIARLYERTLVVSGKKVRP